MTHVTHVIHRLALGQVACTRECFTYCKQNKTSLSRLVGTTVVLHLNFLERLTLHVGGSFTMKCTQV